MPRSSRPRLLLHIGTHKTGTTSIQRFCSTNRDALRDQGLWYPPADIGKFPGHYAHHRIAHAIAGRDPKHDASDATDFFRRVRKQMRSGETCLISAEPMYRHMLPDPYPDGGPARLDDVESNARHDNYAAAVRECIGRFDVTVLVMLRRQDTFLESLYAEHILATSYAGDIHRFARERTTLLDYEARLAGWARAFGAEHLSVEVYDPASSTSPIERDFMNWIGVEWNDRFLIDKRQNVTPSRTLVEFKRALNSPKQSVPLNNRYRRWLEGVVDRFGDLLPDIGRYYLQPDERNELLDRFADVNLAVAETYCGRSDLFDTGLAPAMSDSSARRDFTDADFREIAKLMFRLIAQDASD